MKCVQACLQPKILESPTNYWRSFETEDCRKHLRELNWRDISCGFRVFASCPYMPGII